jgi:hypothetical protein
LRLWLATTSLADASTAVKSAGDGGYKEASVFIAASSSNFVALFANSAVTAFVANAASFVFTSRVDTFAASFYVAYFVAIAAGAFIGTTAALYLIATIAPVTRVFRNRLSVHHSLTT